jgi:hypothetical protein
MTHARFQLGQARQITSHAAPQPNCSTVVASLHNVLPSHVQKAPDAAAQATKHAA